MMHFLTPTATIHGSAGVCELLVVAYDSRMVEPYETGAVQTFRAVQAMSTTDPKLLRRKKIEAAQAEKWHRVQLPQPLSEEASVLAVGYGYSLEREKV